ncbi:hypothetical protein LFN31_003566 [Vibrio cholerae]|nr:hypothetical protein [Vibrio cholerae]EHZ6902807.1 hypothetical protein [Vibrio cholerae]EIE9613188.1 hypothetical protein [Vibrio cholerae]EJK2104598.1 hypothetical protein [Vibrio cholerae]EJL6289751.1 hypothetical protein [Vibrio cholerae]
MALDVCLSDAFT